MVSPGGLSRSIRPGCQQRPQLVALPSSCLSLRAPESSARQTGFPALLAGPLRWALPASTPPLSPRSVPAPRHYFSRCLSLSVFRIFLPPRLPFCHGCGSPPGPKDRPPRHPTSARALAPAGAAQNTVGKSLWPGLWLSEAPDKQFPPLPWGHGHVQQSCPGPGRQLALDTALRKSTRTWRGVTGRILSESFYNLLQYTSRSL